MGIRPPVQPIQPRIVAPSPDEKHNGVPSQSPNMSMINLLQPQPAPVGYGPDPTNLRLPAPQPSLSSSPSQPPAPSPHPLQGVAAAHGQAPQQPQPQASGSRQTTDGLGLLIEAFDTHHTTGPPLPSVPGGTASAPPPPGAVYGPPHSSAPQQYYPPPALATNDGYEHELGYYMSDGVPPVMQQSWASGGGDMYGY